MVTTGSPSSDSSPEPVVKGLPETSGSGEGAGIVDQVAKSILEPGTSNAVVLLMNVAFFLLILVLIGLGFLTQWNLNVVLLLTSSVVLWGAMVFFVLEMNRIQGNPENMPGSDPLLDQATAPVPDETRKER